MLAAWRRLLYMRIHDESLIRVVVCGRIAGTLSIIGGALLTTLLVISYFRHPSVPMRWSVVAAALIGGLVCGIALLAFASLLDRGRAWAFYAITGFAVAAVLLASCALLFTMNPLPVGVLLPALALAAVCGSAWPQVRTIREPKPYAPLKPVPSTSVVIPPPPVRGSSQPLSPEPPTGTVIEIRR